ncbi:tyrosine-type recombinase/integrase [Acidiphilium multivorum]|uniref:tyrosine-type recombinase/integrase n=1 Tax=Acidiphilium multivorum TaxID=62140 RepID=UPI001B8B9A17|nr:integrase arm-type DNA-binding domain-containing protein [Acidiphilium multivorum]MBS3023289.1 integrase arm-type DNA-binding domain-containing protein [Acidiphilium multivorum]
MPRTVSKRLNALAITNANREGNLHDGGGLYLRVRADGSKSWAFRYTLAGRKHWMSLGPLRDVSLAEAREQARQLRNQVRDGYDPLAQRRERQHLAAEQTARTFDAVAAAYIEAHKAEWKNAKHRQQWENTLATYATPIIGKRPVSEISLLDVRRVLDPIWTQKPETASRLRGRVEAVLAYATVHGWRSGDNPARWQGFLDQIYAPKTKVRAVKHHAALDYHEMPTFMAELREREAVSARCLEFAILTATRSNEARGARWDEIDLDSALWLIPEQRMKAKKEHRVPLAPRAVEVLREMAERSARRDGLIFPGGAPGKPMTDVALAKALAVLRPGFTPHGMRSSFREWAAEMTSFPREIAEVALAHINKDRTEAAYQRGDLLAKRRQLMEAWANYCAGLAEESEKVVAMRRA